MPFPYMQDAMNRLRKNASFPEASTTRGGGTATAPGTTVIDRSKPGLARRAGGFLGKRIIAPIATVNALSKQVNPESSRKYEQRFGMPDVPDVSEGDPSTGGFLKHLAVRTGGFASDLGDNLSGGMIGRMLYRDKQGDNSSAIPNANAAENIPITPEATPSQSDPNTTSPAASQPGTTSNSIPAKGPGEEEVIPERGTGYIKNENTGNVTQVSGNPDEQMQQPTQPSKPQRKKNDPGYEQINVPNLAYATDVDALPAFLQQLSQANQTLADNKISGSNERGIIERRKAAQENKKAETDNKKSSLELQQTQQLQEVFNQIAGLSNESDPDGSVRQSLMEQASVLQGNKPGERFDFKTLQSVDPETYQAIQQLVRVDPRTGEYQFIDGAQPGPGSAGDYTQEDLEYTAQQNGMTVDEVKKQLGIQ